MTDPAVLRAEVKALRAEVDVLRNVVHLFYEAGRADALGLKPRVPNSVCVRNLPARHLSVVKS